MCGGDDRMSHQTENRLYQRGISVKRQEHRIEDGYM